MELCRQWNSVVDGSMSPIRIIGFFADVSLLLLLLLLQSASLSFSLLLMPLLLIDPLLFLLFLLLLLIRNYVVFCSSINR